MYFVKGAVSGARGSGPATQNAKAGADSSSVVYVVLVVSLIRLARVISLHSLFSQSEVAHEAAVDGSR